MKLPVFLFSVLLAGSCFAGPPESRFLKIPNPYVQPLEHDHYGYSCSASDSYLVIGAPRASAWDGAEGEPGRVYYRSISGGVPSSTASSYSNPNPYGSRFGHAVDITRWYMVAGAPHNPVNGNSLAGEVYFYDLRGLGPLGYSARACINPNPEGFEQFGYAVAIGYLSGTYRVAVSGLGINTSAQNTGIVHVYQVTSSDAPLQFSIPNSSPAAGEFFGQTLSMDGSILVVGNPGDEGRKGSVDLFDLTSATPTVALHHIVSPAAATENEYFGGSLSIRGSYLIIGAPEGAGYNGRAYLYDLASATPTVPIRVFENPTPGFVGESFGASVDIAYPDLIIGCPQDLRNGANQLGSAYRYNLASATPTTPSVTYENTVDPSHGEAFGATVAVSETNDVFSVSAPYNSHDMGAAGATVCFYNSGTRWTYPRRVINDSFGANMKMDGIHLAVAAPYHDRFGTNTGVIHLYDRTSSTPSMPIVSIPHPSPYESDKFGENMALSGNLLAASCPLHPLGEDFSVGVLYLFDLNAPDPRIPLHTIHSHDATPGGTQFGHGVAMEGTRLLASRDTGYAASSCKVNVYDLSSATPTVPTMVIPNPGDGLRFGEVLAVSGNRVVVGNQRKTVGGILNAGMVYVFDLASTNPLVPVFTITAPTPVREAQFGFNVAIEGAHLLVAVMDENPLTTATLEGKVYAFDLDSGTPTVPVFILEDPTPAENKEFGAALSINNGSILAGAPGFDDPSSGVVGEGIAYRYDWNWTPAGAVRHDYLDVSLVERRSYGAATASSGGWAAISSTTDPTVLDARGSVFLYGPTQPEIVVEQPFDTGLSSGASVDYGYIVQGKPATRQFRIRNIGADHLEISSGIFTAAPSAYTFSGVTFPIIIQPAAHVVVPVVFDAASLGQQQAQLRLLTTDSDESTFVIDLQAHGVTEVQGWRYQYFQTIENTGNAANNADPDGDGFDNGDEFLTGTIPVDAASRLRLEIQPHPSLPDQMNLIISPTRTMVNYRIEVNQGLSGTGWQTLWEGSGSGAGQMPLLDPSSFGQNTRFYRLIAN